MSDARLNRRDVAHRVTNPALGEVSLSIPLVPLDVIKYLRGRFPLKAAGEMTLRDYDVILGHQEIITHLDMLYAEQNPQ